MLKLSTVLLLSLIPAFAWSADTVVTGTDTGTVTHTHFDNVTIDGYAAEAGAEVQVIAKDSVKITDGGFRIAVGASFKIRIVDNFPPVALNDGWLLNEGGTLYKSVVHDNAASMDYDPEGSPLTAEIVTLPQHASSFEFGADGIFTYTHNGSNNSDSFTYRVFDDLAYSNVATVSISYRNVLPTVSSYYFDAPLTGLTVAQAEGLLSTVIDPGLDDIHVAELVSGPEHAQTFALNDDGSFNYVHDQTTQSGLDSFTFKIHDGEGYSNIQQVLLNNLYPPEANDDQFDVDEAGTLTANVMQNDTDVMAPTSEQIPRIIIVTQPQHGVLSMTETEPGIGDFEYIHDGFAAVQDSFVYRYVDTDGLTDEAIVTITINNAVPLAMPDEYTVLEGETLIIEAPGVLANDTDAGNDPMTAVLAQAPAHAVSLTLNSNGYFEYQHDAGEEAVDIFTYVAQDADGTSQPVEVIINITPVNDQLAISTLPVLEAIEGDVYLYEIGVTDPDDQNDGVSLHYELVSGAPTGMEISELGVISWTPQGDLLQTESIVVSVRDDGEDGTVPVTQSFVIAVETTNDAPTISGVPDPDIKVGEIYSFMPDVFDEEGDELSFTIVNRPDWAEFNEYTGALTGQPGSGSVGIYNDIEIAVSDGVNNPVSLDVFQVAVSEHNGPVLDFVSLGGDVFPAPVDSIQIISDQVVTGLLMDDFVLRSSSSQTDIPLTGVSVTEIGANKWSLNGLSSVAVAYAKYRLYVREGAVQNAGGDENLNYAYVDWHVVDSARSIWYVDQFANGLTLGDSWTDAFIKLDQALAVADAGDEIWIASGEYVVSGERSDSFVVPTQVSLFGGFAGNELARSERNSAVHKSILSGDQGVVGEINDNAFTVLRLSEGTVIDGLIIEQGNSNGLVSDEINGAGVITSGSVEIRNCAFNFNSSTGNGGAIWSTDGLLVITNSEFTDNVAQNGGALYKESGEIDVSGMRCSRNSSVDNGTSLYLNGLMDVSLKDFVCYGDSVMGSGGSCVRIANIVESADVVGGILSDNNSGSSAVISVVNSDVRFSNLIIVENNSNGEGGALSIRGSSVDLQTSTLSGNVGSMYGGSVYVDDASVVVHNSILWNNDATVGGEIYASGQNAEIDIQQAVLTTGLGTSAAAAVNGAVINDLGGIQMGDPLFDDQWRLQPISPALDSGLQSLLSQDYLDSDGDGNVTEPLPVDVFGSSRMLGSELDLGAVESGGAKSIVVFGNGIIREPYIFPGSQLFAESIAIQVEGIEKQAKTYYAVTALDGVPDQWILIDVELDEVSFVLNQSSTIHAKSVLHNGMSSVVVKRNFERVWSIVQPVDSGEIFEDSSVANIKFTREEYVDMRMEIPFIITPPTGQENSILLREGVVIFEPGMSSTYFQLPIIDDDVVENHFSTFWVKVPNDGGNFSERSYRYSLYDDDMSAPIVISTYYDANEIVLLCEKPESYLIHELKVVAITSDNGESYVSSVTDYGEYYFLVSLQGDFEVGDSVSTSLAYYDDRGQRGPIAVAVVEVDEEQGATGNVVIADAPIPVISGFRVKDSSTTGDKIGEIIWHQVNDDTGEEETVLLPVSFTNNSYVDLEITVDVPYGTYQVRFHSDEGENEPRGDILGLNEEGVIGLWAVVETKNRNVINGKWVDVFRYTETEKIYVVMDQTAPELEVLRPMDYSTLDLSWSDLEKYRLENKSIILNANSESGNVFLREKLGMNTYAADGFELPVAVLDLSGVSYFQANEPAAKHADGVLGVSPVVVNGIDILKLTNFDTVPEGGSVHTFEGVDSILDYDENEFRRPTGYVKKIFRRSVFYGSKLDIELYDRCGNKASFSQSGLGYNVMKDTTPPMLMDRTEIFHTCSPVNYIDVVLDDAFRLWQGESVSDANELTKVSETSIVNGYDQSKWLLHAPVPLGPSPGFEKNGHATVKVMMQDYYGNIGGPFDIHVRRANHWMNVLGDRTLRETEESDPPEPYAQVRVLQPGRAGARNGQELDVSWRLRYPSEYQGTSDALYSQAIFSGINLFQLSANFGEPYLWLNTYTGGYYWDQYLTNVVPNIESQLQDVNFTITPIERSFPNGESRVIPPLITAINHFPGETDPSQLDDIRIEVTDELLRPILNSGPDEVSVSSHNTDLEILVQGDRISSAHRRYAYYNSGGKSFIRYSATKDGEWYSNEGIDWLNYVTFESDLCWAGEVTTCRIRANFFNKLHEFSGFDLNGDYVHFINSVTGEDVTKPLSDTGVQASEYGASIAIVSQRIVDVDGLGQTLEVSFRVGENVRADLFHVDVNLGEVHGYGDVQSLKQRGVSFNGNYAHRIREAVSVCRLNVYPLTVTQLQTKTIAMEDIVSFEAGHLSIQQEADYLYSINLETDGLDEALCLLRAEQGSYYKVSSLSKSNNEIMFLGGYIPGQDDDLLGNEVDLSIPIGVRLLDEGTPSISYNIEKNLSVTLKRRTTTLALSNSGYQNVAAAPWGSDSLLGDTGLVEFELEDEEFLDLRPGNGLLDLEYDQSFLAADGSYPVDILSWSSTNAFKVAGVMPGTASMIVKLSGFPDMAPLYRINIPVEMPILMEAGANQITTMRQNIEVLKDAVDANELVDEGQLQKAPIPGEAEYKLPGLIGVNGMPLTIELPELRYVKYDWDIYGNIVPNGMGDSLVPDLVIVPEGYRPPTTRVADLLDGTYEFCMSMAGQLLPTGSAVEFTGAGGPSGSDWHWYTPFEHDFGRGWSFGSLHNEVGEGSADLSLLDLSRYLVADLVWTNPNLVAQDNFSQWTDYINTRLRDSSRPQHLWERMRFLRNDNGSVSERPEIYDHTNDLSKSVAVLELQARTYLEEAAKARIKRYCSIFLSADRNGVLTLSGITERTPLPHYGPGLVVSDPSFWTGLLAKWKTPIKDIFSESVMPLNWRIGSPLTVDVLGHMVGQRVDHAIGIAEKVDGLFFVNPDPSLYDEADYESLRNLEIELVKDAEGTPILRIEPSQLRLARAGDPIFKKKNMTAFDLYSSRGNAYRGVTKRYVLKDAPNIMVLATQLDATVADHDWKFEFVVIGSETRRLIHGIQTHVSCNNNLAAVVKRCLKEVATMRAALDYRVIESFYQDYESQGALETVGSFIYRTGSILGLDDVYRAVTKTSFETGQTLTRDELLEVNLALTMELIPIGHLGGVAKNSFRFFTNTAGDAYRSIVRQSITSSVPDSALARAVTNLVNIGNFSLPIKLRTGSNRVRRITMLGFRKTMRAAVEIKDLLLRNPLDLVRLIGARGKAAPLLGVQKGVALPHVGFVKEYIGAGKIRLSNFVNELRPIKIADNIIKYNDDKFTQRALAGARDLAHLRQLNEILKSSCFTADTRVVMADGTHKRIADIRVGEYVLSRSQHDAQASNVMHQVVRTYVRPRAKTLVMRLHKAGNSRSGDDASELVTTANHPFWLVGSGWVRAGDLRRGDRLLTDAGYVVVDGSDAGSEETVYNLEIKDAHTYFVVANYDQHVWVHNHCAEQNRFMKKYNKSKYYKNETEALEAWGKYKQRMEEWQRNVAAFPDLKETFPMPMGPEGILQKGRIGGSGLWSNFYTALARGNRSYREIRLLVKTLYSKANFHHIIPKNIAKKLPYLEKLGFDVDGLFNGIILPTKELGIKFFGGRTIHKGWHSSYDTGIFKALKEIGRKFEGGTLDAAQATVYTQDVIRNARAAFKQRVPPLKRGGTGLEKEELDDMWYNALRVIP